jgi:hypothetical protein
MRTLAKLYPDYESQISRYIEADPAWKFRARLDLARLKRHCGRRNVLLVCHNRGGGTERHLLEQAQAMLAQGDGVFELRPSKRSGSVALMHPGLYGLHNLAVTPLEPQHVLFEALQTLADPRDPPAPPDRLPARHGPHPRRGEPAARDRAAHLGARLLRRSARG